MTEQLTPELIEEATTFMEPTAPTESPKTTDDHMKDLAVWLKDRGVALDVAALGRVSGALCPIEDFRSTTHAFIPILVEAK